MSKKTMKMLRGTVGLAALLVGGAASAQSTFTLNLSSSSNTGVLSCAQNSAGCTHNGVNGKFSAWATTTDDPTTLLQTATISDQNGSGIGVTSGGEATGSPNHAIDSSGKDELVLINFGSQRVSLTGVSSGWSQTDTDVSLLRWTGSSAPNLSTMSLTGSASGLLASGWALVASSDMDGAATSNGTTYGTTSMSLPNSTAASSWWIVSAYFGANSGNLDRDNDFFKLLTVSGCLGTFVNGHCTTGGTGNSVPVPGTLALAGLGLAGSAWRRRAAAAR